MACIEPAMERKFNKDEFLINGLMAGLFMLLLIMFSGGAGSSSQSDSCSPYIEITEIKSDAIQVLPLLLPEIEEEWVISNKGIQRSNTERDIVALLTNSLFITEFKLQSNKYLQIKSQKLNISSTLIQYLHEPEEIPSLV